MCVCVLMCERDGAFIDASWLRDQTLAQMAQPQGRWSLKRSVFAPRTVEADSHDFLDTPQVLNMAFEADWRAMKVSRLVKNDDHRAGVKALLKQWCVVWLALLSSHGPDNYACVAGTAIPCCWMRFACTAACQAALSASPFHSSQVCPSREPPPLFTRSTAISWVPLT